VKPARRQGPLPSQPGKRAERVSAIVEMNRPGVWILGDLADADRGHGMGIVMEFAGSDGKPQWTTPKPSHWDYSMFGRKPAGLVRPDQTIELLIVKHNPALEGFNQWTLDGVAFSMQTMRPLYKVQTGRGYRVKIRNGSDDIHPMHLHRHSSRWCKSAANRRQG
jgi:FtsP/CotA-like multicopper oxidase with cupredoxin domain